MKITEYSAVQELASNNVFLLDGDNGTKKIEASNLLYALADLIGSNKELHRVLWRGKDLGSSFTAAQQAAISEGTFEDLWLGDYWTIGNVTYRIVDFDYWMNSGRSGSQVSQHHVNIMPDEPLYNFAMNTTATASGAYATSNMRTNGLTNAKTTINNAFGSTHILDHTERLINAIDASGYPVNSNHYDHCTVELPTVSMLYNVGQGSDRAYVTMAGIQFAAFAMNPYYINAGKKDFWFRDTAGTTTFKINATSREVYYVSANSSNIGVRPEFAIC